MSLNASGRRDLSNRHNVARYCRKRDVANGIVARSAFLLRTGEPYLSTNWLEHFHDSDRRSQISGVGQALADKGFRVSAAGAFAVLNVGDATDACRAELNRNIQFTVLGEPHDPSHAGIFGYTMADTNIAAVLAKMVREVHPAAA